MKVLVNRCFGGFGVSEAVLDKLGVRSLRALEDELFTKEHPVRTEKLLRTYQPLIEAVEEVGLGKHRLGANGLYADIEIIEIPFDTTNGWQIREHDGREWIAEDHRTW